MKSENIYQIFLMTFFGMFGSILIGFICARAQDGILIGLGIGLGIDFYLQNKKYLFSLLKIKTA